MSSGNKTSKLVTGKHKTSKWSIDKATSKRPLRNRPSECSPPAAPHQHARPVFVPERTRDTTCTWSASWPPPTTAAAPGLAWPPAAPPAVPRSPSPPTGVPCPTCGPGWCCSSRGGRGRCCAVRSPPRGSSAPAPSCRRPCGLSRSRRGWTGLLGTKGREMRSRSCSV